MRQILHLWRARSASLSWREFAATQHGVLCAFQLIELYGLSRRWIEGRINTGDLVRLYPGVYAVGHSRLSYRARLCAAVLACWPGAALSHRSAAFVLGRMPPGNVAVEVTARSRRSYEGIRTYCARSLTDDDVCIVDGIVVTTMFRTLLDLAGVLSRGALAEVVDECRHHGLDADVARGYALTRGRGRKGTAELLLLLSDAAALRNEFERRFRRDVLSRTTVPASLTNHWLRVDGRRRELDNYWPDARLDVELDGYRTHGRRSSFESDRDRDAALLTIDIATIRMTWRQVTDTPATMAGRIGAVYAARVSRFAT